MPRVSDAHLAARRRQIIDAGRACFARNGFHATSIQDVIAEAGLSVGAFYRYFRSKEDLIKAIADEAIGKIIAVIGSVAADDPPPPLDEALGRILESVEPELARGGTFAVALQVWAESVRNPQLAELVHEIYGTMRRHFAELARRCRDASRLPPDTDVEAVGSVLSGLIPAYAMQRIMLGQPDRETYLRGLHTLLSRAEGS